MIAKEIGAELAKSRTSKQLEIKEISEGTRISVEYLKKIELGDFTFLPRPYVTAYIKTFAARVGIDGEALVQKWQDAEAKAKAAAQAEAERLEQNEKPPPQETPKPVIETAGTVQSAPKSSGNSHIKEFGIGAAVIAALALVFYITNKPAEVPEEETSTPMQSANELSIENMIAENEARIDSIASHISQAKPQQQETPAEQPFSLRLEASDTVWIRLVVDGVDSSEYMFRPGNSRTWRAQDYFFLRTGNAGATHIFRDGVPLDSLGRRGQVRQLRITRTEIN